MEINQSSLVADEFIRRLNFPLDATVVHVTDNDRGSMAFETIMILCLWLHAQMDALPLNWTFLMQRTLASCYFLLRDGRSFKHRVQGTKLRFCLFLISPSTIGRLTAEYKVDMRAYQSYKLAYYLFIFFVYHRSRSTAILLCYLSGKTSQQQFRLHLTRMYALHRTSQPGCRADFTFTSCRCQRLLTLMHTYIYIYSKPLFVLKAELDADITNALILHGYAGGGQNRWDFLFRFFLF